MLSDGSPTHVLHQREAQHVFRDQPISTRVSLQPALLFMVSRIVVNYRTVPNFGVISINTVKLKGGPETLNLNQTKFYALKISWKKVLD